MQMYNYENDGFCVPIPNAKQQTPEIILYSE